VEVDEEDEVGLARLVGDAEEPPLLERLAHLLLGVELEVEVVAVDAAVALGVGADGDERPREGDDVDGLPLTEGERLRGRLRLGGARGPEE
jgi:hypothetical protein